MAKSCLVRNSLCVFLLIFITFPATYCSIDNYLYNVDDVYSNGQISFKLQNEHFLQKRQAPNIGDTKTSAKDKLAATSPMKAAQKTIPLRDLMQSPPNVTEKAVNVSASTQISFITSSPSPHLSAPFAKNNQTNGDDEDISISKFSDSTVNFNKTLEAHNITVTQMDTHMYYNSSFKTDANTGHYFWVDMNRSVVSELLSKSHRRAATVKLSFDFPFYGHIIRNVTIATGGFLYTGDYVHSWLAATQYIAPLMANFDTSLSEESYIKYVDNGTAFTVLWQNVSLQEKPDDGKFTFQATLHSTGDIVFVYQNVPLIIEDIQDNHHPVKVGLSDAYIIDRTIFFVRRKTIYEYHRVNFRKEDIKNWTVIYLSALQTCPGIKDCTTCLTKELPNFKCTWCPSVNKCSNGLDRNRQEWLLKNCDKRQIKNETECFQHFSAESYDDSDLTYSHEANFDHVGEDPMGASSRIAHDNILTPVTPVKMGVLGVIAILLMISLAVGLGFWIIYAYRNPHTTSGQILIRYRPSQWSWRRGEARYTAATIHM